MKKIIAMSITFGLSLLVFLTYTLTGCPSSANVPAVETAGIDFTVCVLGQFAVCSSSKTAWPTCMVQIINACGGDAEQITRVVDAHKKAEVLESISSDAGN